MNTPTWFSQDSEFNVVVATDTLVLIIDLDNAASVTNDADSVIDTLNTDILGGLGNRTVYYRDSMGRFDILSHDNGVFNGFRPCSSDQQRFLTTLVAQQITRR